MVKPEVLMRQRSLPSTHSNRCSIEVTDDMDLNQNNVFDPGPEAHQSFLKNWGHASFEGGYSFSMKTKKTKWYQSSPNLEINLYRICPNAQCSSSHYDLQESVDNNQCHVVKIENECTPPQRKKSPVSTSLHNVYETMNNTVLRHQQPAAEDQQQLEEYNEADASFDEEVTFVTI